MLEALHGWEAADPHNGLPVALESVVLYSLHRDEEAFSRWQQAGGMSLVTAHVETMRRALMHLYQRMEVPEPEALVLASGIADFDMGIDARLRNGARIAFYEGRLAQIQGRPRDAVALWDATTGLGDHLAANGTDMGFLVGTAIQTIGAQPVWQWESESDTGTKGGLLVRTEPMSRDTVGYRLWYGPQHAFYVSAAGERASDELRDQLVAARVRLGLMSRGMPDLTAVGRRIAPAWALPRLGLAAAILCAQLLLLFGLASAGNRGTIAGAADVSTWGRAFIAAPFLLGLIWIAYSWWVRGAEGLDSDVVVWLVPSIVVSAVLLLAGIAVRFTRQEAAGVLAVWRANLRRALPMMTTLAALAYLAVTGYAVPARRDITRLLRVEEGKPLVQRLGPEWEHPRIPRDAWRAAWPPKHAKHPAGGSERLVR